MIFRYFLLLFKAKFDIIDKNEPIFERIFTMETLYFVFACFMLLATVDRVIGNRFGVGNEMEKGVMLLGTMTLSMVGMIVLAPVIANWIMPVLNPLKVPNLKPLPAACGAVLMRDD